MFRRGRATPTAMLVLGVVLGAAAVAVALLPLGDGGPATERAVARAPLAPAAGATAAVDEPAPVEARVIDQDGMYEVGTEIAVGRYRAEGTGSRCYVEVTTDASGELRSVVRTYFGDAWGLRVDLEDGQFFRTDACGGWRRLATG